jgi:hypothetical protein
VPSRAQLEQEVLAAVSTAAAVLTALALSSCHAAPAPEQKKADQEQKAEGAAEKAESKPVVDQKIASAMAAARSEAREGVNGGQGAPPQDGILGEDGAARELPAGTAQVVLGGNGAEPRVRLGAPHPAGAGPSGTLRLSYRSGGSVMPTVELDFKAKTGAAETAAPALGAAAGASATGGAPAALSTRFGFVSARPAADQPGRLPENARAEIAKLKGSWVDFLSAPQGGVHSQRYGVAGNNPVLQPLVQGSAVALAAVELPYPEVPVGVGAYWMVKSREMAEGADVVAYRMVKLTELSQNVAHLTLNTRRYLVTPKLALEGLPPHRVRQFQSEGSATISLPVGAAYPSSAEVKDQFASLVSPEERPAQAMPVQSELTAQLTFAP